MRGSLSVNMSLLFRFRKRAIKMHFNIPNPFYRVMVLLLLSMTILFSTSYLSASITYYGSTTKDREYLGNLIGQ